MKHRFKIFPATDKKTHSLQKSYKLDKLMTVNPKTRPPPMCPGKKFFGHLL